MLIVAYKYVTESKYINKTQTKQEQRLTTRAIDQVSWPFTIPVYNTVYRCREVAVSGSPTILFFFNLSDHKRFRSYGQNIEVIGLWRTRVLFVWKGGSNSILVISSYRNLDKPGFWPEYRICHLILKNVCAPFSF